MVEQSPCSETLVNVPASITKAINHIYESEWTSFDDDAPDANALITRLKDRVVLWKSKVVEGYQNEWDDQFDVFELDATLSNRETIKGEFDEGRFEMVLKIYGADGKISDRIQLKLPAEYRKYDDRKIGTDITDPQSKVNLQIKTADGKTGTFVNTNGVRSIPEHEFLTEESFRLSRDRNIK